MNGLLFIDDEEGVRRSLLRALKRETYPTYAVENGEEGIEFLKNNISSIATVISDYKMPGLDGLETLTVIGSLNPEITRIILTGYATMEAAIHATNEGIDGFLTKPFDNIELRAKIREISVRKHLRQFVPEQVYREMESSSGFLESRFHEVSVLFCDIRGFTRMSQDASPEVIASFLNNQFFIPLGEIAYRFNGIVDKHIGDSIMVVFSSTDGSSSDTANAVKSALAMQKKARQINDELRDKKGLKLDIGIGISTGSVFSGILGSLRKKEFTSIGMAVNVAARLESLAGKEEILISESAFEKLSNPVLPDGIEAVALPPATIKGLEDPMVIYRISD
ncbi:MAG: adenylate/guanylate cyclase domain-containing protein [Thermodesulfobacteriota bacterium]|nr:adenylate/guanylate cyclase domain-containing protein [Thermodesulfobacteriota bacterium]